MIHFIYGVLRLARIPVPIPPFCVSFVALLGRAARLVGSTLCGVMYLRSSPPRRWTRLSRNEPTTTKFVPGGLLGGKGNCATALKSARISARASEALVWLWGESS